jgi:uncharacterized protein YaeQ
MDAWWAKEGAGLKKLNNLRVLAIDEDQSSALAVLAERGMQLQCTIQESQSWWNASERTVLIEPRVLVG